jgi:hypothetical protein
MTSARRLGRYNVDGVAHGALPGELGLRGV